MTSWLAAPALFALAMTAANLAWWPRGRPGRAHGRISVLIPARNEQASIETAVRSALAALPPDGEVIVGEDHSDDATALILARLAEEEPRLRVIRPPPLPHGWVGKPHNCHHLAMAARGDTLVFMDADVTLAPDGLARLCDLHDRYRAGVVSAFPTQQMRTPAEVHLMPLLALTYTAWLPLPLVWATGHPALLAANGQLILVDRQTYAAIGGFEAVGSEVVDDMAFCRRAKQLGHRVVFADGRDVASCRMYSSGRDLWRGFTKNLYEGLGERPDRLALAIGLYAAAFVLPYLLVAAGLVGMPALLGPGLLGVAANLATRGLLARSRGHRWRSVVSHPVAVVALLALAVDSARKTRSSGVTWAGRTYARRHERRVV